MTPRERFPRAGPPLATAQWLRSPLRATRRLAAALCLGVAPCLTGVAGLAPGEGAAQAELVVASKAFTESVILGELARLAAPAGLPVRHRRELGGSRIVFAALARGEVDAYPEYTGTLRFELLGTDDLEGALEARGLAMTAPLGFDNSYALGMARQRAAALGVERISDLRRYPDLRLGFSNEFMERGDGWPALRDRYGLPQGDVAGLSHELAYRGIASGSLDVMDLYTTDPQIARYDLVVLTDDRGHFPRYEAVYLYRRDLASRAPGFLASLETLAGTLDAATMIRLNERVQLDGASESAVAAARLGIAAAAVERPPWRRILRRTGEHLGLVAVSLGGAILVAVPLGITAARRPRLGQAVLAATGVLQTVPSLALFVFLIPVFGIGAAPAIAALFVYSLLPIVRNTHAGLVGIAPELVDAARALGLPRGLRLRRIELPLAAGAILAGIKTAAVINVGTATLGALIGAGGYGQPILTGIRLDDLGLILEGAVPAAGLALLTQWAFDGLERLAAPGRA